MAEPPQRQDFFRFTIGRKLSFYTVINLLLLIAIGWYAVAQMRLIGTEVAAVAELNIPLNKSLLKIENHRLEQTIHLKRALRLAKDIGTNDQEPFNQSQAQFSRLSKLIQSEFNDFDNYIQQDLKLAVASEKKPAFKEVLIALRRIKTGHQDYGQQALAILSLIAQGSSDDNQYRNELDKLAAEQQTLDQQIKTLIGQVKDLTQAALLTSQQQEKAAQRGIIILVSIALALGMLGSFFLTRMLLKPIKDINAISKKIAEGDLEQQIKKISGDELGDLGRSVNKIVDTLNTVVDQAEAIAAGDYSVEVIQKGERDRCGIALQEMKNQILEHTRSLNESEKRSRGIVDTAVDGIITMTDRGVILSVNKATEQLFRYRADELIGHKINMLMPEPYSSQHDAILTKYRKTGVKKVIGIGLDGTGRRKDGSCFPLFVSAGEIKLKDQVVFAGFVRDTSKIKQYQQDLQRSNDDLISQNELKSQISKIAELIQGATDLQVMSDNIISALATMIGAGHGVLYVTRFEGELTGQLSLTGSYAFKKRKNILANIPLGEGLVGQCGKEKKAIVLTQAPPDYIQINSGLGEQTPLNLLVVPILFEQQLMGVIELASFKHFSATQQEMIEQVTGNIGIVINNLRNQQQTQLLLQQTQRQAEELQSQQEELRSANENLQQQTEMLKSSEQELQQQSEELKLSNEELLEQQQALKKQKDQIESAKGDITIKANELALASKYKSEFLANMSHELRTPLNSLLLLAKDLADNKKGHLDSTEVEDARIIHDGGTSLLSLINDIMDLSKVEAGQLPAHIEDITIEKITGDLRKMFDPIAHDRNLIFNIELASDAPQTICSDGQRLEQILRNLLSNAMKFTPQGKVTLRIEPVAADIKFNHSDLGHHPAIAFKVTDSGIGIPPDKQQAIFEAFQQQDGSTSRQYGGTGLGLTIVRELTRLLGGEVQLSSQPGQGSILCCFYPSHCHQRLKSKTWPSHPGNHS